MLDLCCCEGLSFVAVLGLLFAVASLAVERELQSTGSVVVAYGLSCSGIFPDQGLDCVSCTDRWILHH